MNAHDGVCSASRAGCTYSRINGYSGIGLAGNPLARGAENIPTTAASYDPYVEEQRQRQILLKNPSLRIESDGSAVYDPNFLPKCKKIISMAPYHQHDELDVVEPLFWLVCASVVGLATFIAFTIISEMKLPFIFLYGTKNYAASASCAGFMFAVMFLFYACSSNDERCLGRFADGLIGAAPFLLLGAAIGYMYSSLVLMMLYFVEESAAYSMDIIWWYSIFSAVPPFVLLFIPMFVVAMQVQEASAISARIFKGLPAPPEGFVPRTNQALPYTFSAVRRFLIGFFMGVGIASYYSTTCFAIGLLAYGLHLSSEVYFWLPIVVAVLGLMLLVGILLCVSPHVVSDFLAPWTQPLAGWSRVPFRSSYFPRYYVGLTVKQMIRETNALTRLAGKYHVRGEVARAEELYIEADARRAEIETCGIELRERDCRSWRKLQTRLRSGVTRKPEKK